ncbi:MAG: ABC transporter ATP-binding protein [Rubrivivax sp.]|nr:ABC transporter ATP-binding protein [Rubrivivax sp.]
MNGETESQPRPVQACATRSAPTYRPVLLRVCGVHLALQDRIVLDGLDLELAAGEIHGLLGANGSGKSSLAYAVMGCEAYRCSAGEIWFDGHRIDALPIHERARLGITLAWQEPARIEGLRIRDYLRVGRGEVEVEDCLRRVGLDPHDFADRAVDKTLSGGERKRVELAAVLAMQPKLAILDEPTAGIDLLSLDTLIEVIEALRTAGSTVLLITHQAEVAAHADRASQLCGGRIVYQGETARVLEHYRRRACRRCDGKVCHA